MSFDERFFKLTNLAVESFRRLGRKGEDLLEQVVTSVFRGEECGGKARKGVSMERIKRVISITAQVATPRSGCSRTSCPEREAGKEESSQSCGEYSPSWRVGMEYIGRKHKEKHTCPLGDSKMIISYYNPSK